MKASAFYPIFISSVYRPLTFLSLFIVIAVIWFLHLIAYLLNIESIPGSR